MPAPTPPVIPEAFANDNPTYREDIPDVTVEDDRASWSLGFPPRTMQPIQAGGGPPWGQDMNGVLYMLSSHTVFAQSGEPYKYSADVATLLTGYAVGTVLGMSDGSGLWINRTPNNMTDPDAGGAGWRPVYSYGTAAVPVTGGTVALSAAQSKKKFIVLQGALVANLSVEVPVAVQDWLFINQTTGAFITTVRVAGQSGGVTIPQGGPAAPTGVYCDGANAYPVVAPLGVPIDQAPSALSLVQRTNAGYVLATYFNTNAPLSGGSISALYYETGNDGFIRKITPINAAAQMALSWFGGQVANGQVPYSAVQQYAAALFSSPAFTGVPTAPTAALGTSNSQVATTAFANPASGASGVQFPGGNRFQWGVVAVGAGGAQAVAFPVAFSAAYGVLAFGMNTGGSAQAADVATNLTAAGFTLRNAASVARTFFWLAVGNG